MPERESFRTVLALGISSGGWAFSGRYHCRACKRSQYPYGVDTHSTTVYSHQWQQVICICTSMAYPLGRLGCSMKTSSSSAFFRSVIAQLKQQSSKNARESQTSVKSMMIKSYANFASYFPLLLHTSIETRPPYHLYLYTHNHYFSILRLLSPSQAAKPSQCPQFSRKLPLHTPG